MSGKDYCVALMETCKAPQFLIKDLEFLRREEKWHDLSIKMSLWKEWLAVTFEAYWRYVPNGERYNFLINLYICGGDHIPAIRKEMRTAKRYGAPSLPNALESQGTITVFRAGDEVIEKATYRLSWTTDRAIAEKFMVYSGLRKLSDMHLYTGEIKRDKIIAFTNDREESEIIQYRGVKNISEIQRMTYEEIVDKFFKAREKNIA